MNVLSLFDGISCGQVALRKAGIEVSNYFSSEVDSDAIKVAMSNFPNTIQLGDVHKLSASELPQIDLMMGGSPCQDLSNANPNKTGIHGKKSSLFFEFVRLLKEIKPKYFLFENVRMKKKDEQIVTDNLGVKPIYINSNLVSPQNRPRLYWTNIPQTEIKEKNVLLPQVLEPEVDDSYYLKDIAKRDKNRLLISKKQKAYTLTTGSEQLIISKYGNAYGVHLVYDTGCYSRKGKKKDFFVPPIFKDDEDLNQYVRRLTPVERERLMNLPDNYTSMIPTTKRYKVLGNGWDVSVIKHLLKNIDYKPFSQF